MDTAIDTATGPFFDIGLLTVGGYFTWDESTQQLVTGTSAGVAIEPGYEITLALSNWNFDRNDTASYCLISLPFVNATPSTVQVGDPRLLWGVDYDPADGAFTNCGTPGYDLDPAIWGPDILDVFVTPYTSNYFMAIGAPSVPVSDFFTTYAPTYTPTLIGGSLGVPDLLGTTPVGVLEDVYAFAFAVDANFDIDLTSSLLSSSVDVGNGNIASGFYTMNSLYVWAL